MKEAAKNRSKDWLLWLVAVLLGVLLFFNFKEAFSDEIHGYRTVQECWDDVDQVAGNGARTRVAETHTDELTFHAHSSLGYYSMGTKCYQANESIRKEIWDTAMINAASGTASITVTVVGAGPLSGAYRAVTGLIGEFLGWLLADAVLEAGGRPTVTDVVVNLSRDEALKVWKDPCSVFSSPSVEGVSSAALGIWIKECRKNNPVRTELKASQRREMTPPPKKTDLSTCDQNTLQLAEDFTYEGAIGEDWIENLAKQGKTCDEIESIVIGWITALIEADAPMVGPPSHWPGNWPSRRPTPPSD